MLALRVDARFAAITYKIDRSMLDDISDEYDKARNRPETAGSFARTGVPDGVSTTNYNAANHQTTFGDKILAYDDNGNLTSITDSGGTTTYSWNARNQLVGISGPAVSASFVYDGLGRREKKTINSDLTEFLYDGVNPVQETSGSTVLANILPGLGIDEFLSRTDVVAGVTSGFLADALGSPVAVTDNAGAVQTEYTYEPFGKTTVIGASNTNPFQYTGRENDGTGLYYYRARYYHPDLQRFISEDPFYHPTFGQCLAAHTSLLRVPSLAPGFINNGKNVNIYTYVDNGPIRYRDPLGLDKMDDDDCQDKGDTIRMAGFGACLIRQGIDNHAGATLCAIACGFSPGGGSIPWCAACLGIGTYLVLECWQEADRIPNPC